MRPVDRRLAGLLETIIESRDQDEIDA